MDETKPTSQDFDLHLALDKLNRTIQYARLRCLTPNEIIDRISSVDKTNNPIDYLHRLSQIELNHSELEYLENAMKELAARSERAPSSLKARVDRILLRLVRMVPSELAVRFAEPFVDHPRKGRRKWAYAALRDKQISGAIAAKLAKNFRETGDQDALELIARNPERVPEVGADFLLNNLNEKYWRTRVLEALLMYDRPTALSLSQQYPFEFVHAVGRTEDKSLLGPLCAFFEANSNDLEFLSIYAYALGKLAARGELELLEEFCREKRPAGPPFGS